VGALDHYDNVLDPLECECCEVHGEPRPCYECWVEYEETMEEWERERR
jgi:hypothetical protein